MKTGRTVQELAAEIERQQNSKVDLLAPTTKMRLAVKDEKVKMRIGDDYEFDINPVAHGQIAAHTGVPKVYYDKMLKEAPELLKTNVEEWFDRYPATRMARGLDTYLRAFLSDSFRPLENYDLAAVCIPILREQGMDIWSCDITETRLYIKAVDSRVQADVPTGRKMGDGSHVFFDTVSPAAIISNSEVGMGMLKIETGIFTKICTNMATISGEGMKRRHVGGKHFLSDVESIQHLLTTEAKQASDKAVFLQVRDVLTNAFNEERFQKHTDKLKGLVEQKIDGDPVKVIEFSSKRLGLTEGESKSVLRHLIEGGDLTRYGLMAAITRTAEDAESYDRASEIEVIGGDVIELPANDWQRLAEAA